MKRRDFLKLLGVAPAAALASKLPVSPAPEKASAPLFNVGRIGLQRIYVIGTEFKIYITRTTNEFNGVNFVPTRQRIQFTQGWAVCPDPGVVKDPDFAMAVDETSEIKIVERNGAELVFTPKWDEEKGEFERVVYQPAVSLGSFSSISGGTPTIHMAGGTIEIRGYKGGLNIV